MKKIISSTALFSTLFLSLTPVVLAQRSDTGGGTGNGVGNGSQTLCPPGNFNALCNGSLQPGAIIANFISFIFVLAVVVALLYLIWGGFKWLTSGGDKTAVGAAREHIVAALVGLILIFLSYFILNLIIGFFIPGFKLNQFKIPTITGQ